MQAEANAVRAGENEGARAHLSPTSGDRPRCDERRRDERMDECRRDRPYRFVEPETRGVSSVVVSGLYTVRL